MTSDLQEKLKVPRILRKKGSKHKIFFSKSDLDSFENLKRSLLEGIRLKIPNPGRPFIIRTDASDKAVGGVLEQMDDNKPLPPVGSEENIKTYPVAFFSRKLTTNQMKTWPVREKEAYAIVSILKKYTSLIGHQPILILTDHKSLENWATEILDTPGGPSGRRARWHILLSRFKLEIRYMKGASNGVADAMSRWAYPAGCGDDVYFHGTSDEELKMKRLIEQEKREEMNSKIANLLHLEWIESKESSDQHLSMFVSTLPILENRKVLDLFCGQGS